MRVRMLAIAAVTMLLAAGPAGARPSPTPTVDVHSAAGLAPDGRSLTVTVLASCPERWTVVEATVSVVQPQASGSASFPLTCIGSLRSFTVVVPAAAGTFDLQDAGVSAEVIVERGKTARADDAENVDVEPRIEVELAGTARLQSGGAGVTIDVTVACPVGVTALRSALNVSQGGRVSGNGAYTPVCDGLPHTFTVDVQAAEGTYQPGEALALTFANTEHEGQGFSGVDDGPVQLVE